MELARAIKSNKNAVLLVTVQALRCGQAEGDQARPSHTHTHDHTQTHILHYSVLLTCKPGYE
jgi:hypothetical protein